MSDRIDQLRRAWWAASDAADDAQDREFEAWRAFAREFRSVNGREPTEKEELELRDRIEATPPDC